MELLGLLLVTFLSGALIAVIAITALIRFTDDFEGFMTGLQSMTGVLTALFIASWAYYIFW